MGPSELVETSLISVDINAMEAVCVSLLEIGEAVIHRVSPFRLYLLELVLRVRVNLSGVIATGD